ncbi:hypothetical protein TAGGR_2343 [Thermodesulfovibrio aggregans]|uniref:DUF3782 domain-containing protein n=1 Tax=Thermodesulfovibrio aggregans TaxID=86166 RepID=A0A0U9HUB6_9BACT|nr:hypothetical protein [Thermodesulfovibrio aggregans]GAQ95450.1 hypothetical protein TAGGR_2343 [Thermodesulfovibrio aggregans]
MPVLEERVSKLEEVLEEFIRSVGIEFNKLYNSQMRTEAELRAFKEEMREFKNEMREFKNEMREFKNEMLEFKKRQEEENRRKNQEWSNLAKKMGTIVEDLVAPALRPVLKKYFNCEVTLEGQRMFRRKNGEDYEIDAIAACEDKVFMIEVRSTPRVQDVDAIKEKSRRFFEFFPEFAQGRQLIIIFGSITFPDNVIKYATRSGIYVMGWREWEYMDILNFEEIG